MRSSKPCKEDPIWILVYTKPKEENRANENLQRQGFKTFLPLIASNNKTQEFKDLVPVFPRYIFVQINQDLDNWTPIKSSHGVSNIVMFSEKFTPIQNNIIELIKDKLDESDIFREEISIVDHQKGDLVSIIEGQFAGIDAIFLSKKSKDRVRLLLKFLNTSVVAEIMESDVGHKEIIKEFKF